MESTFKTLLHSKRRMRSRRKERRKGISETDIREIIESWLELVRSPGRNDAGMYTRRSSAPWKHQSLPFSGCFQRCFPANRLRSNIKISGRKHALAYKRDFPLSRAPLEEKKGVERRRVERSFRLQGETNLQTRKKEGSRSLLPVARYSIQPVENIRIIFVWICFFFFSQGKISTRLKYTFGNLLFITDIHDTLLIIEK